MVPPRDFQEVTPGPLSYGTTSGLPPQRPLADKWRSEVCFHHNLYDTIEAQGHQFGIKHPVALLTGTCALVLLVIIATLRPAVPLHAPFADPDAGMFASSDGELLFQQLPCWTGSCDNWQFEDAKGEYPLDYNECDELSAGFGCNPCKREFTPGSGGLSDYKKSGRVVVCPTAPADGEIVGEYMAMGAKEYPQSLGMLHLPCVGACCSYYLLQAALHPQLPKQTAYGTRTPPCVLRPPLAGRFAGFLEAGPSVRLLGRDLRLRLPLQLDKRSGCRQRPQGLCGCRGPAPSRQQGRQVRGRAVGGRAVAGADEAHGLENRIQRARVGYTQEECERAMKLASQIARRVGCGS